MSLMMEAGAVKRLLLDRIGDDRCGIARHRELHRPVDKGDDLRRRIRRGLAHGRRTGKGDIEDGNGPREDGGRLRRGDMIAATGTSSRRSAIRLSR